jgi:Protein of unknown function (DUF3631)
MYQFTAAAMSLDNSRRGPRRSGIGTLPETVRDRAIEFEMVRKRPDETVRRLRRMDGCDLNVLCQKLARWAQDNLEKLHDSDSAAPSGLDDRAADAWEPLFAIADLVGGDWPQRARRPALELSGERVKEDDEIGTVLLGDIRDIVESPYHDIYATKEGDKQNAENDSAINACDLVTALAPVPLGDRVMNAAAIDMLAAARALGGEVKLGNPGRLKVIAPAPLPQDRATAGGQVLFLNLARISQTTTRAG